MIGNHSTKKYVKPDIRMIMSSAVVEQEFSILVQKTSESMAHQTTSIVTKQDSTAVEKHVPPKVTENTLIQTSKANELTFQQWRKSKIHRLGASEPRPPCKSHKFDISLVTILNYIAKTHHNDSYNTVMWCWFMVMNPINSLRNPVSKGARTA